MEQLDIVIQTVNGLHITLASVPDEAHGAEVAYALYQFYSIPRQVPAGAPQIRFLWLRSSTVYRGESEPQNKHLVRAWPEAWQDEEDHKASIAAWKSSPRGVSGDESEPNESDTRHAIEALLARLPERYQPQELSCTAGQYKLYVADAVVCHKLYAREAIRRAQNYVEEHERADWKLPTGVVNGIYD